MRVYEVEYISESPIIISRPSITNVFHNLYRYLPGSTIRGAILTYLRNKYDYDIDKEMIEPNILFHPAFPVEDNLVYKPAHVLLFKCKLCKENEDPYYLVNPYSFDIDNYEMTIKCKNGHPFALKSIGGELITIKDGKVKEYKPKYAIFDSVGINRVTGSSDVNLLYTYIAIINTRYRGLIVTKDSFKYDLKELLNDKVIFIGKGINRGFGCVRIIIEEISKDDIIKKYKRSDKVIFKALSPLFNIVINNKGLVSNYKFRIGSRDCKILSNSLTQISGFSMISNTSKVKITALKEGSLLITNSISQDDITNTVLGGIGNFSCSGFNIVEVLDYDLPY